MQPITKIETPYFQRYPGWNEDPSKDTSIMKNPIPAKPIACWRVIPMQDGSPWVTDGIDSGFNPDQLLAQRDALLIALKALDDTINEPGNHADWTAAVVKASDQARQVIASVKDGAL